MESAQQNKTQPSKANASSVKSGAVSFKAPDPFGKQDTVQRHIYDSYHDNDDEIGTAMAYETALDNAVQDAFHHVIGAPNLGNMADLDGHTRQWVQSWQSYMNGNDPGTIPTNFGYAVESLTTNDTYFPDDPAGCTHELQGVRGGTRPDVILMRNGVDIAWLDITASESHGHIWGKEGWNDFAHASEATYPSLTDAYVSMMEANNAVVNPAGFDADAFEQQRLQAQQLYDLRVQHWTTLGILIRADFMAARGNISREVAGLNPQRFLQNPLLGVLNNRFNLGLAAPVDGMADSPGIANLRGRAPHILAGLRQGSAIYGFVGGGEKAGEAWLRATDPNLPQLPAADDEEEAENNDAVVDMAVVDNDDE